MIAKEKETYSGDDERAKYGHRQEEDVAFHLRRAFGDDPEVVIFNDLRLKHAEENAQIDHLIMHPFGFIIIESKSISGEVRVNAAGEWQRSYRGNWAGLKSPLRQAELQQDILKRLLIEHRTHLMNKTLGLQGGFAGRQWKVLCAVSSNAIVHRDDMAKGISARVVKPEFLQEQITALIGARSMVKRAFSFDTRPEFTRDELERISEFLLKQDARSRRVQAVETVRREVSYRVKKAADSSALADNTSSSWEVNERALVGSRRGEEAGASISAATSEPALRVVKTLRKRVGVVTTAPSVEQSDIHPVSQASAVSREDKVSPRLSEHLDRITARLNGSAAPSAPGEVLIRCQKCQEQAALMGCYGPYGYYVKCRSCNANTSLKQGCPACEHASVRLSKSGAVYSGHCPQCEHEFVIFRQTD